LKLLNFVQEGRGGGGRDILETCPQFHKTTVVKELLLLLHAWAKPKFDMILHFTTFVFLCQFFFSRTRQRERLLTPSYGKDHRPSPQLVVPWPNTFMYENFITIFLFFTSLPGALQHDLGPDRALLLLLLLLLRLLLLLIGNKSILPSFPSQAQQVPVSIF
jgi:hypothetical protein